MNVKAMHALNSSPYDRETPNFGVIPMLAMHSEINFHAYHICKNCNSKLFTKIFSSLAKKRTICITGYVPKHFECHALKMWKNAECQNFFFIFKGMVQDRLCNKILVKHIKYAESATDFTPNEFCEAKELKTPCYIPIQWFIYASPRQEKKKRVIEYESHDKFFQLGRDSYITHMAPKGLTSGSSIKNIAIFIAYKKFIVRSKTCIIRRCF